jgi:hypothetical protein
MTVRELQIELDMFQGDEEVIIAGRGVNPRIVALLPHWECVCGWSAVMNRVGNGKEEEENEQQDVRWNEVVSKGGS